MLRCTRCNRPIQTDHGGIPGQPLGPTCARAIVGQRDKGVKVVRCDQPDLFEDESHDPTNKALPVLRQ